MIQALSDKLNELFLTLEGVDQPFVKVLDYHTLDNDWYPYMTFEPVGFEAEIADTCNNLRTYVFQILIFQDIVDSVGRKDAKEIITKAIDSVVWLLDSNYTLDWLVTMVKPVGWTIKPFLINNWKALVWELAINIQVLEFIN